MQTEWYYAGKIEHNVSGEGGKGLTERTVTVRKRAAVTHRRRGLGQLGMSSGEVNEPVAHPRERGVA